MGWPQDFDPYTVGGENLDEIYQTNLTRHFLTFNYLYEEEIRKVKRDDISLKIIDIVSACDNRITQLNNTLPDAIIQI